MEKGTKNKNFKIDLNLKSIGRFLASFLNERFQFLAFLILIGCLVLLVFLWHNYIFSADWSEAEVQNYTQAKQTKSDVTFNRENFQKVIEESNSRRSEFERALNDLPDIFRLKK